MKYLIVKRTDLDDFRPVLTMRRLGGRKIIDKTLTSRERE
jgi:hypothetical protein